MFRRFFTWFVNWSWGVPVLFLIAFIVIVITHLPASAHGDHLGCAENPPSSPPGWHCSHPPTEWDKARKQCDDLRKYAAMPKGHNNARARMAKLGCYLK